MARKGSSAFMAGCLLLAGVAWHLRNLPGFVGSTTAKTGRQSCVPMEANKKEIKERIVSVGKTGKLTDAMRLVAAAKVRKAQAGLEKSRPFSDELQSMIKGLVKKLKGSGLEAELPMLRIPEKVNNVGIVLITSNRGLCGPYNTFVIKKAIARIKDLNDQGITPKIIVVGKKGLGALGNRLKAVELEYTGTFIEMPDTITSSEVANVADEMRNLFLSGEVDKVEVIYSKFINLIKNEPQLRTILPLSPTGIEDPEDETFALTSEDGKLSAKRDKVSKKDAKTIEPDVIFDQAPEVILNSMLPLYLSSQLLSMLFDAQASELSSRMTAMQAATDNAKEVAKDLTTVYNKARQAAITQELCEITAGLLVVAGDGDAVDEGREEDQESVESDFLREIEFGDVLDGPPEVRPHQGDANYKPPKYLEEAYKEFATANN